jgi:hypothetical protein
LSGGGVDDADVQVLNEHKDVGCGVGSSDADGVELPAVAQGDLAGFVDAVVAEPLVCLAVAVLGRAGFGAGLLGGGGGGVPGQGSVWSAMVVLVDECLDQRLELADVGGLGGLGAEPVLQGLWEAFDFAAGGGVVGSGVLLGHAEPVQVVFEAVRYGSSRNGAPLPGALTDRAG